MNKIGWLIFTTVALTFASGAWAEMRFFDMGTADSKLYEGATRVTAADVYSADRGFGWQSAEGLSEQARALEEMGERRGSPAPPVMWTNAITEDCVIGEGANAFLIDAPAGEYRVYLLCGTSDNTRYYVWDFEVAVTQTASQAALRAGEVDGTPPREPEAAHVQLDGGLQHRPVRLLGGTEDGRLAISLTPANRWLVSCIIIASPSEWPQVERDIIAPLEEWTFFLPPAEQENWKLDPPPAPEPMPELSAADRERGWVVFHRPWPEVIWPNTTPRAEEIGREVRIFASPGEYEPVTFCVHLLRDVEMLHVTEGGGQPPRPFDDVDIRHVRYMRARPNYVGMGVYRIVPDVLEPLWMFEQRHIYDPAAPVGLTAGTTHRFWLTLHLRDDAEPGEYRWTFQVSDGENLVDVPVRLRVLPIKLQDDPSKIYGMYYRHPLDNWSRARDEVSKQYYLRRAEAEHEDLVAHGMRNVVLSAWCPTANDAGEFEADWTVLEAKLEMCERYGFTGPYVTSINAGGIYRKYMDGESWGSHTGNAGTPPPEYAAELTAMTRFIESERERYGWPVFLYYPIDEPGRDAASVELVRITMEAIRAGGGPTYLTADPTHEAFQPLKPVIDVWCTQPFLPDRETVRADMAARDVQYWCYPNKSCGENDHTTVRGGRMTYGFGFWRSGFVALIPWIYSSTTSDPLNYLTGAAMDFLVRHEPDGTPMSVTIWESYREGHDDYRYVYTLEQLIARARASGNADAVAAADEARRELDYVWNAIEVQDRYMYDGLWPAGDFDVYRWIIAEQIMKLQDAVPG